MFRRPEFNYVFMYNFLVNKEFKMYQVENIIEKKYHFFIGSKINLTNEIPAMRKKQKLSFILWEILA